MFLFIKKIILLFIMVSTVLGIISMYPGWRYDFTNGQTESNLFIMPKNKSSDIVILGSSHGRLFSRGETHELIEKILEKSIINLSVSAGGIYVADLYLDYFLSLGNRAQTIIYFIDPWALYNADNNEKHDLNEPLNLNFLSFVAKRGVNLKVFFNYFYYKTTWKWILQSPGTTKPIKDELTVADKKEFDKDINKKLNFDSIDGKNFLKYKEYLYSICKTADEKNIRLIMIIPTTLRGNTFAEENLKDELKKVQNVCEIEYYDYSNTITDPHFYYDISHLNLKGAIEFTEKYLKPILDN